jgi:biotin carboxyl carrier protein
MPGSVVDTPVGERDAVAAGDVLIVIESMKLETSLRATQDGLVEQVHFQPGETFERDAVLVTLARTPEA